MPRPRQRAYARHPQLTQSRPALLLISIRCWNHCWQHDNNNISVARKNTHLRGHHLRTRLVIVLRCRCEMKRQPVTSDILVGFSWAGSWPYCDNKPYLFPGHVMRPACLGDSGGRRGLKLHRGGSLRQPPLQASPFCAQFPRLTEAIEGAGREGPPASPSTSRHGSHVAPARGRKQVGLIRLRALTSVGRWGQAHPSFSQFS